MVLAAVGNLGDLEQGGDNAISYPGACPGVITVAASGADGARAPFSSVHSYIDVAAPGVAINAADSRSGGRKPGEGTSSACALAAGVSALIVSKYPDLAPRQVEQVLEKTASPGTAASAATGRSGWAHTAVHRCCWVRGRRYSARTGSVPTAAAWSRAARSTPSVWCPVSSGAASRHTRRRLPGAGTRSRRAGR
ncbi:S8 family peptidase [Streptomyces sp. enrichment culture]|uniref:S8 family peptidase n=1 Tax=Streptomyces sp. enrichment culture TaxID=1795815 RepID=UPI003F55074E